MTGTFAINATNTGMSEYTGWSPVGLVEHDGETIVLQSDGTLVQDGSTDDGTTFNWTVKTGATLLGDPSSGAKSIPRDYLSFFASGSFTVTIAGERRGKLVSFSRTVSGRRESILREEPVKLARGLTSHRFQRTMTGVEGSSIDLHAWTSLVIPLGRTT